MQDEDQAGTPSTDEKDQARAEGGMEPPLHDPKNVVPFSRPQERAADVANPHPDDDPWPFDDVAMPSYVEKYDATAIERPVALVVPQRRSINADAAGPGAESRIPLFWGDCHRVNPEGSVLRDADDQVLDLEMFRKLRDQLGAWLDAPGQEREVLEALHCAAYRADEPGIGAPVL